MSTENDDLDEVLEPADAAPPPVKRRVLPGPGLGESLLWILGFLAVQVGFSVAVQLAVGIWSGGNDQRLADDLGPSGVVAITLLPMVLTLLIVVPAAILRLRPDPLRKLNFSFPSVTQLVILLATTAALSLFGSSIQAVVQAELVEYLEKNQPDILDMLESLDFQSTLLDFREAAFPVLLFFLAVAPAIGEEFLFRGVIGRGLVARSGIVAGVIMTSLLFAGVHMYPPQVIGLLPLAIFLHIAYLATRSFWAPMLVHFGNIAIAAAMLQFGPAVDEPLAVVPLTTVDWILMIVSGLVGALGAIALWSVRTEYLNADGEVASPAYPTVERPPQHLGLKRSAPMNVVLILVFTGVLLLETYVFWNSLAVEPDVEPAEPREVELTVSLTPLLDPQAFHVPLAT